MAASRDVHVEICHQEIIKYDLEIKALIQDIRECIGPISALNDLNAQVKDKFQLLRLRIQDLEQMAKEQDKESDKQALLKEMECHKKQMLRNVTKENLAESTSGITESLMSVSRMMAQQVQQSEITMHTLATSSRTVQEANEEFKSMSGTIQLGRKLITKYNRRELTDKLLIFLALALFLATVLYILKKRLFPF
ncbi:PREDICTED: vesicle transport protein SEC20 isoform X2 [Nanorana parkeri]|uniref:vesicle transport protein SEC20 isoform X2 n=1 Tax=Nanorana parkeri TaxID=125878 RepID=UPI0008547399|nr:PREDICTED: vesicle transport protein SEC20 isoform X2 [Nanorana parkeri]